MFDFSEAALVLFSGVLMVIALVLAFIPIMPGTFLVWAVAIVTAFLLDFTRITPVAAGLITAIFLVGITSDFWLPLVGVKSRGLTCMSALGSLVGGLVGTFFIPIPILGTLIGCVAGAALVEFVAMRNMDSVMRASRTAFSLFIVGYLIEIGTSIAIAVIFFISLITTA